MWNQVGPQPVQVSEIVAYTKDILGIEDYSTRFKYLRLIRSMDRVELEHIAKKSKTR